MDSILTTTELDALLKATEFGSSTKTVKPVDLISRDHQAFALLPKLQEVAQQLALITGRFITQLLRSSSKVSADAVEVVPGSRLPDLLEGPRFVYGLNIGACPGAGLITVDGVLGTAFIERQFGGESEQLLTGDGPPTMTERRTVARLAARILIGLKAAMERVSEFEAIVELEPPELLKNPGKAVAMVLLALHVMVGEHRCAITIGIDTAAAGFKIAEIEAPIIEPAKPYLTPALKRVPISLSAVLGTVEMPVTRLLSLRPGDLITLDTPVDSEIPVLVEGKPKFLGTPTIARGSLSIQITQRITE